MTHLGRQDDDLHNSNGTQPDALRIALENLLEFVTSGRRYETQNPYTIPEVEAAYKALGRDWRYER